MGKLNHAGLAGMGPTESGYTATTTIMIIEHDANQAIITVAN